VSAAARQTITILRRKGAACKSAYRGAFIVGSGKAKPGASVESVRRREDAEAPSGKEYLLSS